jgi:N-acetylglutamate synthase-like GNAT family acetyltransferase
MHRYAEYGGTSKAPGNLTVRPLRIEEVEAVRSVGQRSWSDLASRDLGRKVKYPLRPSKVIEAYLWKEPEGCLVAEEEGRIVGSAFCHVWGKVGWVGPFEVLPEKQDMGVGRALMQACDGYMERKGCQVFGLETMPHVTKNIHFYMRAGYVATSITLISVRALVEAPMQTAPEVTEASMDDLDQLLPEVAELSSKVNPLLDYSKEVEMAVRFHLGACFAWHRSGRVRGVALLHCVHPPEDSDHAAVRLVVVDPEVTNRRQVFDALLDACEARTLELRRKRVFARYSAENVRLYHALLERGYRLEASNMRMVRGGPFREEGTYHLAAWAG